MSEFPRSKYGGGGGGGEVLDNENFAVAFGLTCDSTWSAEKVPTRPNDVDVDADVDADADVDDGMNSGALAVSRDLEKVEVAPVLLVEIP